MRLPTLPMVVVLPTPLTPTNSHTFVRPSSRCSVRSATGEPLLHLALERVDELVRRSSRPSAFTRARRPSSSSVVGPMPTSARSSASSSSSQVSSSIGGRDRGSRRTCCGPWRAGPGTRVAWVGRRPRARVDDDRVDLGDRLARRPRARPRASAVPRPRRSARRAARARRRRRAGPVEGDVADPADEQDGDDDEDDHELHGRGEPNEADRTAEPETARTSATREPARGRSGLPTVAGPCARCVPAGRCHAAPAGDGVSSPGAPPRVTSTCWVLPSRSTVMRRLRARGRRS